MSQDARFLLWDFDGTLAQRAGGWSSALAEAAAQSAPQLGLTPGDLRQHLQKGFPWHAPEIEHAGLTAEEWWAELHPLFARAYRAAGADPDQARQLAGQVRAAYLNPAAWRRFDDALPALQALSARGWQHVLLSNHVPELPHLLARLALESSFAAVFNSAQTGWEKPNPHAFRRALDWIGPGATVWMIGDNLKSDLLGAREAGLPGVLVRQRVAGLPCCDHLMALVEILGGE